MKIYYGATCFFVFQSGMRRSSVLSRMNSPQLFSITFAFGARRLCGQLAVDGASGKEDEEAATLL